MTIDYIKLSPTGNITVLVKTPVPRAQQAGLAARLLREDCVGGEQVGYVENAADSRAAARLQMMGGEFCGNATMSLAAVLARDAGLKEGAAMDLRLEVSGSAGLVPCHIHRQGDGWIGTVSMPLPTRVSRFVPPTGECPGGIPLVEFPGIAHLILHAEAGIGEARLREVLPLWLDDIGADALGALTWSAADGYMDPLVYVPSAGTLVREHGCGSGSAAIGAWLALRAGHSLNAAVSQPGGIIEARAEMDGGALRALSITGRVVLLEQGTVQL